MDHRASPSVRRVTSYRALSQCSPGPSPRISHQMQLENTEDFYPLSPLQEGMLFHALYSPEGGEYISQIISTMPGDFDVAAFKQALQRVVQRHAALRTFFIWE